ncbi:HEAT repeat domain-containing protein [Streptomyces phaeofaciens]|uniref:hypothetical protein n=1 Tax=Streptomyces phaeofaciens TaxID=68254 RepID=UPI0036C54D11
MRSPEELDTVDWPSLHHAYGDAHDVPDWIHAVHGDDADRADKALEALFGSVLHQGSVYPATVAAVPFLAHAAVHAVHGRADVLAFLAGAAGHGPEPQPGAEEDGCARVAAEVPGLLRLLTDDDPRVRRQTVRVARRARAQDVPAALRELAVSYTTDPVASVRAEALTVLTRLDADPASVERRLRTALTDPVAAVRATAALALLERARAPYPADLVAVLVADGADGEFTVEELEFFPGVGTTDDRLTEVLAEDPDAAVAVAHGWIGRGDAGGRGSRRATQLSVTWRDREHDTVRLLTAALGHEHTFWDLLHLLNGIGTWLPGVPHPDPALGDALLRHALDDTTSAAAQAQTLLGRLGDERLLTVVPDPAAPALAALAARTRHPAHQRLALRHPAASGLGELLGTLTPDTARGLLPELTGLLRRHPDEALVRRFGDWCLPDPDVRRMLDEIAAGDDKLAPAAAVAAARLGAGPDTALRVLEHRLRDNGWCLEEAGLLGPAAAPLLPLIEEHLGNGYEWHRMHAAEAHWRITEDASTARPVLTALAGPLPVGVRALRTLLLIGPPFPADLRPRLLRWSTSERRLLPSYALSADGDGRSLDDRLRDAARQMLA